MTVRPADTSKIKTTACDDEFSNLALEKSDLLVSIARTEDADRVFLGSKHEDKSMDLHAFKMLLVYLIGCLAVVRASSNDRPILQEITLPRKLVENQNIKLNCDLTQGAKPIKLSWFFNDAPIKENERLQIDNRRDDVSSLVIKSLSSDSVGRYKCVATNDYGSDQQTGTVHVNSE